MHRSCSISRSTHTPTQPLAAHCVLPALPSHGLGLCSPQGNLRPVVAASSADSSKPASNSSQPSSKKQPNVVPRDFYSSPWNSNTSAPGAASTGPQPDPDSSKAGGGTSGDENDPWKDVLSTGHTLSSLYLQQFEVRGSEDKHGWVARVAAGSRGREAQLDNTL